MNNQELVEQVAGFMKRFDMRAGVAENYAEALLTLPAIAEALEIAQRYEEATVVTEPFGWLGTYRLVREEGDDAS